MPDQPPDDNFQTAPSHLDPHALGEMEQFLQRVNAPDAETTRSNLSVPSELTLGPAASPDLVASPPPGYKILGELGRGGMGVVYQTRHIQLNRMVALKMILAGGPARPNERSRFLAEAEAVAGLHQPNIVPLLEFGKHQGLPFFTLEFVPGGNLASRLNGVPQPPRVAAQLLEQLARGIHYAHSHGIVHRDLKPTGMSK